MTLNVFHKIFGEGFNKLVKKKFRKGHEEIYLSRILSFNVI